jgi:4'-phosphopantetheinyl transferase
MDKNARFMESITDIRELPRLDDETVHVWGVHLPDVIDRLDILYTRLCVEEREKADRFFREQDRQASIAARGALRMLLAGYTQRTPREIDIRYTDNGKPHVAESDVDFNLSHSDEWVVLSFGRNRRIGVDLEKIRRDLDVQSIAARYFEIAP